MYHQEDEATITILVDSIEKWDLNHQQILQPFALQNMAVVDE